MVDYCSFCVMKNRARDFGLLFYGGETGRHNNITDVPGVSVGYSTIIEEGRIHTGVTAILPRGRDRSTSHCVAATHCLNGNGEMTGTAWVNELGALSSPIMITNTYAVGSVHRALIDWVNEGNSSDKPYEGILPIVAETWDGFLSDIKGENNIMFIVFYIYKYS